MALIPLTLCIFNTVLWLFIYTTQDKRSKEKQWKMIWRGLYSLNLIGGKFHKTELEIKENIDIKLKRHKFNLDCGMKSMNNKCYCYFSTLVYHDCGPEFKLVFVDKVGIFGIFLGVLPFPHYHSTNILHLLSPFPHFHIIHIYHFNFG